MYKCMLLYWVSMDMLQPHYGLCMHLAAALLLVPDIPLTDKKTSKKVYNLITTYNFMVYQMFYFYFTKYDV